MGSRIVLASVLLVLPAAWLSTEAQYFRPSPFAGAFRHAPDGSPGGVYPGDRSDVAGPSVPATYRTLCVRLCDGFYFPISFAVPESGFNRDAEQCRASCGPEARLFYHLNPGGSVETMFDLAGRAYSALPTAFTYRKTLVAGCSCRPQGLASPAADGAERAANTRAPEPATPASIDYSVDRGEGRALARPEPIVRDVSNPVWGSLQARDLSGVPAMPAGACASLSRRCDPWPRRARHPAR
jgi:hypothetical protein